MTHITRFFRLVLFFIINSLLPYANSSLHATSHFHLESLPTSLPGEPTLTVVFDLDETLAYNRQLIGPATLRHKSQEVLRQLKEKKPELEIILWTASTWDTARPVIDDLCQDESIFDVIITRDTDGWFKEGSPTIKDLNLLPRSLARTVLIDNSPICGAATPQSLIAVVDFNGSTDHRDYTMENIYNLLLHLLDKTKEAYAVPDVLTSLLERRPHTASMRSPVFLATGMDYVERLMRWLDSARLDQALRERLIPTPPTNLLIRLNHFGAIYFPHMAPRHESPEHVVSVSRLRVPLAMHLAAASEECPVEIVE